MSDLKTFIKKDDIEDKLHVAHAQDVAPFIARNTRDRNAADKHAAWGETARVASIPAVVVLQWMKEGINVMAPNKDDLKRMKKKLNSPEYAYLRTGGGRL
jgi:hypothetical protein